jgi:NAD(P)-dependent dehydrogenase (short-subunit alcohol dehydrogenase family)
VTGGNSGIGLETVSRLLEKNAEVLVLDKTCAAAKKRFPAAQDDGRLTLSEVDIVDQQAVRTAVDGWVAGKGPIEALVNSAGIVLTVPFQDETPEDWHRVLSVNLTGVFNTCSAVVPHMAANGRGSIVNVSSISGLKPSVFSSSAYCASKAGVIGFSRCLASQLASSQIRVNCVAPCTTDTPMIEAVNVDVREAYRMSVPLGRLAQAGDIASAILYLLSDESSFVTGETINVNGGLHMP